MIYKGQAIRGTAIVAVFQIVRLSEGAILGAYQQLFASLIQSLEG
jgi:hypothetical protein